MQEQKTLSVRQFHYVTWPDHGVPHSPDPLLAFWKMLRQWLDQTVGGGPPLYTAREDQPEPSVRKPPPWGSETRVLWVLRNF